MGTSRNEEETSRPLHQAQPKEDGEEGRGKGQKGQWDRGKFGDKPLDHYRRFFYS